MNKNSESKVSKELRDRLNEKDRVAFISAVDTNSIPALTIIPFFIAKDEESLLFAVHRDDSTYKNLVKNKKIVFGVFDSGNFCCRITGRAGVVKAPSDTHPLMNIVRLDVISIEKEPSPFMDVVDGIKIKYVDQKASRFAVAMLGELKKVAAQL
ncbi:MAG: pyridoxamine 5'-phosphate oxidase family protein [Candidatus Schekmanbacteria bacterium]|nr:pyridoxamine 5'-phosphate oxidase family protein [Candidatus Schekmanbacteria bacterium]